MSTPQFFPALADLSQDIAEPIPVAVVQSWLESPRDDQAHARILQPYHKTGIMVSSDASGLSKLSAGRSLLEVMKLVSQPKELVHAFGTAIGGRAIGIWAADNTQMFYGDEIAPAAVVEQMIAAQRAIASLPVQIGIGIHQGSAYEIGGGLYGADADEIEEFTEEESQAGEVIVSTAVHATLPAALNPVLAERGRMRVLAHAGLEVTGTSSDNIYYPAPFDRAFHERLLSLDFSDQAGWSALHQERVRRRCVVLVRVFPTATSRLLDDFMYRVATNTLVHGIARDFACQLVKSNGVLAILVCDDLQTAVDLGLAMQHKLTAKGLVVNVGVAEGELLVFTLDQGGFDIAGSPVNIASKLAEDTSERGRIFIAGDELSAAARQHGLTTPFEITKSGVTLRGVRA